MCGLRPSIRSITSALLVCAAAAAPARAHEGRPPEPHDLWTAWSLEPFVLGGLALSAGCYARGVRRMPGRSLLDRESLLFAGGWLALFVALVSPLDPMGGALFSAHMTQHEVLMLFAAPLLVLGRPLAPFMLALPVRMRRRLAGAGRVGWVRGAWRALTNPFAAWLIHAAVLWLWHAPSLFQATLDSEAVHAAQHLSFLVSALLFCEALIHGAEGRMGYGAAVVYVFTTAVHTSVLGALLTFSSTLWYPAYEATAAAWGLTPLEDQQLGGLIMWVPAGLVYVAAGLWLLALWLGEAERRAVKQAARQGRWPGAAVLCAAVLSQFSPSAEANGLAARAYVSNERAGTISVINTETDQVVASIHVGGRPRGVRVSRDGGRIYVAVTHPEKPDRAGEIVVIDAATAKITARYAAGTDPEQFDLSRDGARLYVSNEDAGTASITDLRTGRVMATLVVGIEPEGVKTSPDGRWVYVTSEAGNSVAVIDARTNRVASNILVGPRPRDVAFSPDGARAFVTAENGAGVTVVDARRHLAVGTIKLPPASRPMAALVSPDGRRVYISNGRGNSVTVIDADNLRLLATIPTGARTWGLALTADGKKLYAANSLANTVSVIDTATQRVTATVTVGDGPWGVAIAQPRGAGRSRRRSGR
jgi:putative membrane protein